jgi:hypothetical protein
VIELLARALLADMRRFPAQEREVAGATDVPPPGSE